MAAKKVPKPKIMLVNIISKQNDLWLLRYRNKNRVQQNKGIVGLRFSQNPLQLQIYMSSLLLELRTWNWWLEEKQEKRKGENSSKVAIFHLAAIFPCYDLDRKPKNETLPFSLGPLLASFPAMIVTEKKDMRSYKLFLKKRSVFYNPQLLGHFHQLPINSPYHYRSLTD